MNGHVMNPEMRRAASAIVALGWFAGRSVAVQPAAPPAPGPWHAEVPAFVAADFPGMNVVNRGVGGGRLGVLAEFAPRLVAAVRPRVIVDNRRHPSATANSRRAAILRPVLATLLREAGEPAAAREPAVPAPGPRRQVLGGD